jgi:hypothetical protein
MRSERIMMNWKTGQRSKWRQNWFPRRKATLYEINASIRRVTTAGTPEEADRLLGLFNRRLTFWRNQVEASRFLSCFSVDFLVHGHTPIPLMTSCPDKPLVYAGGLCINVDTGLNAELTVWLADWKGPVPEKGCHQPSAWHAPKSRRKKKDRDYITKGEHSDENQ